MEKKLRPGRACCKQRTESLLPFMDRLVADLNATVSKDVLDIPKAQAETVIQPDSVADDLARKTIALKGINRRCRHDHHLNRSKHPVKATLPLPWLYLKGVSTGQFEEALTVLLGPKAGGLSPTTIRRLVEVWQDEHKRWQGRDLSF